jgi:predicted NBD/HSP70 family sugar kinase
MMLTREQRSVLRQLWRGGAQSRSGLHELTGVAPNRVGLAASVLLERGIVRECQARSSGGGRPRIPLEIDPAQRHMIGLTIWPGAVSAARLNLQGHLVGKPLGRYVHGGPGRLVAAAASLLGKVINDQTIGVGVSAPGFYDPKSRRILSGLVVPDERPVSLSPLFDRAGDLPLVVENDMHALGARWLLTHRADAGHDVLLVSLKDGALGAAMLIGGRPSRGCVSSANELGHMRYLADTSRCYCGQTGCLERIFSTEYLNHIGSAEVSADMGEGGPLWGHGGGSAGGTLMERSARYEPGDGPGDEPLETLYGYLANGIVNVVNFIRPHRLVLVSELTRYPGVCDLLTRSIRSRLLGELVDRVRFDLWDQPVANPAETAGWLALANLYYDGWQG